MSNGLKDKMMGEGKEMVGKVTGNQELEAEGKMDQAKGKAKEVAEEVIHKAETVAEGVKEKAEEAFESAKDAFGKLTGK